MYIFHEDAGHGWLEVPLKEIKELKLSDDISGFSYVNKDKAYLEEDCDLTVFVKAKLGKKQDEIITQDEWISFWTENVDDIWDGDNSFIRQFKHHKVV